MSEIIGRNVEVRILYSDEYGLKSSSYCYMKCDCCGKTFQHYTSENIYKSDFDKARFCSYNCRSHYYKIHHKKRQEYLFREEMKLELTRQKQAEYERKRYALRKSHNQDKNAKTSEKLA